MKKQHKTEEAPTPDQVRDYEAVTRYLDGLRADPVRAKGVVEELAKLHKWTHVSDWRSFDRGNALKACSLMALKHDLTAGELKLRSIFVDGTDALHACRMMVKKFGFDTKSLGLEPNDAAPHKAKAEEPGFVDLSKGRGDLTEAEEDWLCTIGFNESPTVLETTNTFNGSKQSTEFSYFHHTGWLVLATTSARWFYHTQHKRWIHPTKIVAEVERAEREKP